MLTAKQISDFVEENREEAIRCLQEIIQTPSITGDEEPVSFVFEKWMTENGLKVDRLEAKPHRPNLLSEWCGSQPGKRFVFNGHMDVFPPDPNDPGMYGPWSAKIVDGYMYGRGTADMKGGDCGALMAVIFLKRMGYDPKGSVLLSFMCDEEHGGELGVQWLLKNGYLRGDFGICPEPSDGKIIPVHGGILRGYVEYTAQAQSTGIPYKYGMHALQKAIKATLAIEKINERLQHVKVEGLPPPLVSVSVMHAGTFANVNPTEATFWVDRRLVPGETHDEAETEIRGILDALKAEDPSMDYKFTVTSRRPLLEVPMDDPFVLLMAKSFEQIMDKPVEIVPRPAGSDAAWIQKVTGMPMPNFGGAGCMSEAGKPNEKISVQVYLDYIKIYMMTIVNALG